MWAAWLGFEISQRDRQEEIIEGGELRKSPEAYNELMRLALEQIGEVLKTGGWLSLVYAHRDTSYWQFLTEAARAARLEYVNTVVQPVGVVWSMHKKKNPLRVLSGELVLNFRKVARLPKRRMGPSRRRDPRLLVRGWCERAIVGAVGATTEELHHQVIPLLLETGLLQQFSQACPDLTPFLERHFEFDRGSRKWHLQVRHEFAGRASREDLVRYHVLRLIEQSKPHIPTLEDALSFLQAVANLSAVSVSATARRVLAGRCEAHETRAKQPADRRQKLLVFNE